MTRWLSSSGSLQSWIGKGPVPPDFRAGALLPLLLLALPVGRRGGCFPDDNRRNVRRQIAIEHAGPFVGAAGKSQYHAGHRYRHQPARSATRALKPGYSWVIAIHSDVA